MIKAHSAFGAGCALLALSACTTHLDVDHALPSDPASRRGIAYFLPFTQFDTKTTWTLAACDAQDVPEIAVTFAADPVSAPDPDHLYTIDYSSLDAISKTSSVKVDFYDSGAIKSINAAAEDRTAEIAGKTISAAAKIAKFAFPGAALNGPKNFACSKAAKDNLAELRKAKGKVTNLTATLEKATDALDALTVRVVRSDDTTPPRVFAELDRQIARVVAIQLEIGQAKKVAAALLKTLSYTSETKFPATSGEFRSQQQKLPLTTLRGWIANLDAVAAQNGATGLVAYEREQSVFLELTANGGWQDGKDYPAGRGQESRRAGLRYRVAVPGRLSVCQNTWCSDFDNEPVEVEPGLPVRILQRGTTFYLPFASAPFSNGALSATFSESGVMTSAGYEQKKAAGEAIAGLADLLADEVVTVGGAIREAKKTKLETLNERTAIAKAIKEAQDAEKALIEGPDSELATQSASLAADTALKNAELANILADVAVRKARLERDAAIAGQ